jgi:hypothetical protein
VPIEPPEHAPAALVDFVARVQAGAGPYRVRFERPGGRPGDLTGEPARELIAALADRQSFLIPAEPACSDGGVTIELRRGDLALTLRHDCSRLTWTTGGRVPDAYAGESLMTRLSDAERAATPVPDR